MTRDPLSNALRSAAARYEASYSKAGAHADPGLGSRVRRRRIVTVAAASTLSLALVGATGVAAALAFRHGEDSPVDPAVPPVPEGYERIVISVPNEDGWFGMDAMLDPVLNAAGLYGEACGTTLPEFDDEAPFDLVLTSAVSGTGAFFADTDVTDIEANASLRYDGNSSGAARIGLAAWVLLRDDGTIVQSAGGVISSDRNSYRFSLAEPFTSAQTGFIPPLDCAKADADAHARVWEAEFADPGSYSIVAVVPVEWSPEASVILNAASLGLDPTWFGDGWQDVIPCGDAVTEAKHRQNGDVIECAPHLYYRQIFNQSTPTGAGDYLLVDVPDGFLSSPRKTWYVVSDPYPIEWTGRELTPIA